PIADAEEEALAEEAVQEVLALEALDEGVAAEAVILAVEEVGNLQANDPRIALLMRYVRTERGLVRRACALSESQLGELEKLDAAWLRKQIAQPDFPGKANV